MEQEELLCNPVAVQLSRANAMVLELRALAEDIELTEKDSYPSEPIIKLLRHAATKIEQQAHMIRKATSGLQYVQTDIWALASKYLGIWPAKDSNQ